MVNTLLPKKKKKKLFLLQKVKKEEAQFRLFALDPKF
jgi:hypothetical protein